MTKASASQRRIVWGRYLLVFFVAAWMFVLGVLVGRGTAPVNFDTQALQKELKALRDAMLQKEREEVERAMRGEDQQNNLQFYKALKTDEPDAAMAIPAPPQAQPEPPPDNRPNAAPEAGPPHKTKAPVMAKPAAGAVKPASPPPPKAPPRASPNGQFTIQVAAMKDGAAAERIVANLKKDGYSAYLSRIVIPGKGLWFRVRVGSYSSREQAAADMQRLARSKQKPILVSNK